MIVNIYWIFSDRVRERTIKHSNKDKNKWKERQRKAKSKDHGQSNMMA